MSFLPIISQVELAPNYEPSGLTVTPFGLALYELRRDRRMPQKQLASLLNLDQSYLSGLESGRKGSPPTTIVQRVKSALSLNDEEAASLQRAADRSRRKVEIPTNAEPGNPPIFRAR